MRHQKGKGLPNYIPKASNFYGLSNIHKSEEIKIAIEAPKFEYIKISNHSDIKFHALPINSANYSTTTIPI